MCGRFTLADIGQLPLRFGLEEPGEAGGEGTVPRYNIAPAQPVLTIVERSGRRTLESMRWGFSPEWLKNSKAPAPINARAETMLERSMFRGAVGSHRCLVPADGFYEWQVRPGTKTKQPMYIRLGSGVVFAFAGIFTRAADGQDTCAIITTGPNQLMEDIHNRMPVILPREAEAPWLDPDLTDPQFILPLLKPYPAEEMIAVAVGPRVGSFRNDDPGLIEPVKS